jgi:GT2 family glycosyltransferase
VSARAIAGTSGNGRVVRPFEFSLPLVTVVIPVLNDAAGLERCLASIQANDYPVNRLEIIVADNGSTDGSPEVAERMGATVVRVPRQSVASVRNQVAAQAAGRIIAFVDADHELSPNWLRSAVGALAQPGVAAAGAPYHPPQNATWVQRLYDAFRVHSAEPIETRWLGSGNLAIWKSSFEQIGGFDTTLTTCEDVDFCQRLRGHGGVLIADERMRSVHYGDPGTLKQLFNSELWRGRDNLVVSFRVPLTLRDMPSVAIPVVMLGCLGALPAALMAAGFGVRLPLTLLTAVLLAAPAARAVSVARRLGDWSPRVLAQAFAVACTYDLARSLALVVRKAHRRA